jgi:archaeal flagellin FlaB
MSTRYIRAMRYLRKGHKDQRGMTGLETAIILIAFVTVAAVFGYAILSAGLFSSERAKETVYAGLDQAKSNLEVSSSVIAVNDTSIDNETVDSITFCVKNSIAGKPIDLTPNYGATENQNKTVISLRTATKYFENVKWSVTPVGTTNGDNILSNGGDVPDSVDFQ